MQIAVQYLVTFIFKFNLLNSLVSEDFDSFRTSFWLEEKRWYVAYRHPCLFSVPHFCATSADKNDVLPLYSTVPDNNIFYQCIDTLDLLEDRDDGKHYFTHVQTLSLRYLILLSTVEKIVNLSRVQHLILYSSMKHFPIMDIINKMPNLRQISIRNKLQDFLQQIRSETIEKTRILEIGNHHRNTDNYSIDKLCIVFPNIEHLHVEHKCSIVQILHFLDRFKHLSTASFQYKSLNDHDDDRMQTYRLKIQSILDQIRPLPRLKSTYRFNRSSVHIWM